MGREATVKFSRYGQLSEFIATNGLVDLHLLVFNYMVQHENPTLCTLNCNWVLVQMAVPNHVYMSVGWH